MNKQQREEIDKLKMRLELKKMGVQDIQEKLSFILEDGSLCNITQELNCSIENIDKAIKLLDDIMQNGV